MLYKHRNKQLLIGIYTPKKKKERINLSVNDEPLSLDNVLMSIMTPGKSKKKNQPWYNVDENRKQQVTSSAD